MRRILLGFVIGVGLLVLPVGADRRIHVEIGLPDGSTSGIAVSGGV